MPSNDLVILDQVLAEQRTSVSPEMDHAEFFEAFTAEQILKDRDVSWDDIESGIIGGGGDGGIDSAYLFLNGVLVQEDTDLTSVSGNITLELVLLQSKRSDRFSESTVQKFHASLKDLLDLTVQPSTLASTYHAEIIRFFERFHEAYRTHAAKLPDLSLAISYATRGENPSSNVTRQVANVRDAVKEHFRDADFSFEFVGAARLLELVRRRPRTSFGLPFKEDITGDGGNVALVKLTDFKDFITAETGALNKAMFDANVRDHQGDVTVNKSIRDSLEHPGDEDFWWLNNGITIVADKVTAAGKKYTIENPQIVNGLQTSFELFSHFETTSEGDDRCLLERRVAEIRMLDRENTVQAALASFEQSLGALEDELAAELAAGQLLSGSPGPAAPPSSPRTPGTAEPGRSVQPADPPGWERIYEGSFLEAVLLTQLTGDFPGPVLAMVSVPFYSADRQRILIPRGTRVVGTARAVQDPDQSRLAVAFHRLLLPDGSWIDLEFTGLNQAGEGALQDQVDRHYFSTFAAAGAIGVVSGLALAGGSPFGLRAGVGQGLGQSATSVLDRFLNRLPTITIRAGHRLRIWFTSDVLVPRAGTRQ